MSIIERETHEFSNNKHYLFSIFLILLASIAMVIIPIFILVYSYQSNPEALNKRGVVLYQKTTDYIFQQNSSWNHA